MSRPFSTRPGGRLDASFRDMTEADIKATLQSCRSCRWWTAYPPTLSDAGDGRCRAPTPICLFSSARRSMHAAEGQTCPTWEARAAIKQAEEELETDR